MGQIPDNVIDEVRRRADIVEVISSYLPLKKAGANYRALCPFHQEKSPSFNVNPQRQIFHCFGCGEGGNVITFVMKREGLSFPEAVKSLAGRYGIDVPEDLEKKVGDHDEIYSATAAASDFYHQRLLRENRSSPAVKYLAKRGITSAITEKFRLGYSPAEWDALFNHLSGEGFTPQLLEKAGLCKQSSRGSWIDRFRNRIMFPICDSTGRPVGFGARVLGDGEPDEPKYLNSPETLIYIKSRALYGYHLAKERARKENYIFVVEGYMDVIALHKAGVENCVACAGTSLTTGQADMLRRVCERVVALFDSDTAGVQAARRAGPILMERGLKTRAMVLRGFKDPDEFLSARGVKEFVELAAKAPTFHEFLIDMTLSSANLSDIESKMAAIREIIPFIRSLDNEVEKSHYVRLLSERASVDYQALAREISKGASPSAQPARTSGKPPAQRRQAPIRRAERAFLGVLMAYPALTDKLTENISPDDFSDPVLKSVYEAIREAFSKGAVHAADMLNSAQDDPVRREMASISGEMAPDGEEAAEKTAQDCLSRIRAGRGERKKALEEFLEEFKDGEKKGDMDEAKKAHEKYSNLRKN
jgi:DNA primase